MVKFDDGRSGRVRSLGPHTTIGEMGLITRQLRSATIQAELDSVLYALSFEAYERLKSENRPLHQALLGYVVTVMAERLSFASKVIAAPLKAIATHYAVDWYARRIDARLAPTARLRSPIPSKAWAVSA